ncbi:hypothetical protein CRI94_05230 [Longibacter salinarum]|uniref:Uncharacterized protein n=1 Tax=Longibacter salinarum TaxID=1850348 RepID=A0A2A8D0M1_9BACT|nr:hypothetical protein CRI94_05230 [Longibacter salinarum]
MNFERIDRTLLASFRLYVLNGERAKRVHPLRIGPYASPTTMWLDSLDNYTANGLSESDST